MMANVTKRGWADAWFEPRPVAVFGASDTQRKDRQCSSEKLGCSVQPIQERNSGGSGSSFGNCSRRIPYSSELRFVEE